MYQVIKLLFACKSKVAILSFGHETIYIRISRNVNVCVQIIKPMVVDETLVFKNGVCHAIIG